MTISHETAVKQALVAWCRARGMEVLSEPRHVHPVCYVVGKSGYGKASLTYAAPWVDSEPHMQEHDKASPLKTTDLFDESLEAGQWCSTGYVVHATGQERIAIPVVPHLAPQKADQ